MRISDWHRIGISSLNFEIKDASILKFKLTFISIAIRLNIITHIYEIFTFFSSLLRNLVTLNCTKLRFCN